MDSTTRKFITIWEDTWHEMIRQMRPDDTIDAYLRRVLNMTPRKGARPLRKRRGQRERELEAASA